MTHLYLSTNQLTGKHFCSQIDRLVYEFTTTLKRPPCFAGTIPTELGRCTAMKNLILHSNGLTGTHFRAQIARRVYEFTAECFVPGNALAGAIPTEIGQLAQLKNLGLDQNQLTGE